MSVVAALSVPATEFLFRAVPTIGDGAEMRLERFVPLDGGPAPYLIVHGGDVDAMVDRLEADPAVERVDVLDAGTEEALVRVEWRPIDGGLREVLDDVDAAVLDAVVVGDRWRLTLRFPTHESLSACHRRCAESGIDIEVEQLRHTSLGTLSDDAAELSEVQRETLLVALEAGYFNVPRETTLQELADRLGVSDTAVSQRIRRGVERLLSATLQ